jgi:glutamate-1-semialdehyde 2,1-aminomutase
LHPLVADNVRDIQRYSGCEQVSFHMSGTEAVMQAVRLARYHTGRQKIVRFCGAYHGWWGEVQPGIGNPVDEQHTFTLSEMSDRALKVIRKRKDIACVLINPLQAMHLNSAAPGDSTLIGNARTAAYDRATYTAWLQRIREACDQNGVALIMDEVFLGFRLAPGGAQEYFKVKADIVTYGKTIGGGLPVGVVCADTPWMRRYKSNRPVDICFARGTFNSHPYVMGAMREFFERLDSNECKALYADIDQRWNSRCERLNQRLRNAQLPVKTVNMGTVWTILYEMPSRYNWMLQFYLRAEGLYLSWVGSGRMIFSLAYDDQRFDVFCARFERACARMKTDGWWTNDAVNPATVRSQVVKETLSALLRRG